MNFNFKNVVVNLYYILNDRYYRYSNIIIKKIFGKNFVDANLVRRGGKVIDKFEAPSKNPTGLALEGKTYLWHCDAFSGKIYRLDLATRRIDRTFKAPTDHPWGLAWDGETLWNTDDLKGILYQIDPEDGSVIKSFEYPNTDLHGLAYDGEYIIATDRINCMFYWIDTETGEIVRKIPTPTYNPRAESGGLSYDGKYLWHSNGTEATIYIINPANGTTIGKVQLMKTHPHDLAWIQDMTIYIAIRNLRSIYKIKVELRLGEEG